MKRLLTLFCFVVALAVHLSAQPVLYGATSNVIVQYDVATGTYLKLYDLPNKIVRGGLLKALDGKLYGLADSSRKVIIFSFDPVSRTYVTELTQLLYLNGEVPAHGLVQASDGKLYAMTTTGGSSGGRIDGVIFSFDPVTKIFEKLHDFSRETGGIPFGGLLQASNLKLYGTTTDDPPLGSGRLFSFDPVTRNYTVLGFFANINASQPIGKPVQVSNGKLYGMTYYGGPGFTTSNPYESFGIIYSYDPATGVFRHVRSLQEIGAKNAVGSLMQASDGKLYGMSSGGGINGKGVLFSLDPATDIFEKLKDFGVEVSYSPLSDLMQASDGKLYGTAGGYTTGIGVLFSYDLQTKQFKRIADFGGTQGPLIEANECSHKPTISVSSGSSSSGLSYRYYEGSWTQLPDFGGLTPVASGKVQNVTLLPRKHDDQFAFLFEGSITIPKAGRYYFETSSDDGSRLYIGNYGHYVTPVVDNDGQHGLQTRGGWYTFPAPGQYPIAVSYFEQGGEEQLHLYWGSADAGIPMHTPIPDGAFAPQASSATSTLTYAYYEGSWDRLPDFGGLTPVERGQVSNIDLSGRKRDEQFAFLFEGRITIPKAGWYYFETFSDDGSKLYIGNYGHYITPVVDNDGQHAALLRGGWYRFPAAGQYPFALSFFEQSGEQQMKLFWGSNDAGIPMHTQIPDEAFQQGGAPCGNVTLTASEGDSYLWNTGETTRSITVRQTGSYSVTVTKDGCLATSEPTLITCTDNSITQTGGNRKSGVSQNVTANSSRLTVKVLPNPSSSHFTLQLSSSSTEKITLRVTDEIGRTVETKNNVASTGTFTLGHNYRPGVYYAQVAQGRETKTLKLVKGPAL